MIKDKIPNRRSMEKRSAVISKLFENKTFESEEELDEMLEEDTDWSDECVYNYDAKSNTIETGREWLSQEEIK